MNAFYYILEANCYLIVLFGFYLVFLKRETFYTLNRSYFLLIPFLALLLPSFRLSGLHHDVGLAANPVNIPAPSKADDSLFYIKTGALFYLSVILILGIRLIYRIRMITSLVKLGATQRDGGIILVPIRENQSFSFLNYLFMQAGTGKEDTIIRHEKVHIEQLHSYDVLFYEIIKIINWFNPAISLMQRELKAIHEFIADEKTAVYEDDPADYALFLIKNSHAASANRLANPIFNKSLLKERIMKLNQQKSGRAARLKYALLLLLLPTLVFATGKAFKKDYGAFDLMPGVSPVKLEPVRDVKGRIVVRKDIQDTLHKSKAAAPPKPKVQVRRYLPPAPAPYTPEELAKMTPAARARYWKVINQLPAAQRKRYPPPVVEDQPIVRKLLPPPPPEPPKPRIDKAPPPPSPEPPKPRIDRAPSKVKQVRYPPPVPAPKKKAAKPVQVIIHEPIRNDDVRIDEPVKSNDVRIDEPVGNRPLKEGGN